MFGTNRFFLLLGIHNRFILAEKLHARAVDVACTNCRKTTTRSVHRKTKTVAYLTAAQRWGLTLVLARRLTRGETRQLSVLDLLANTICVGGQKVIGSTAINANRLRLGW